MFGNLNCEKTDVEKFESLSKREMQILAYLYDNYKQRDIAKELGLNFKTISTYFRRLCIKLNIKSYTMMELAKFIILNNFKPKRNLEITKEETYDETYAKTD